jgi:hypothetical protein
VGDQLAIGIPDLDRPLAADRDAFVVSSGTPFGRRCRLRGLRGWRSARPRCGRNCGLCRWLCRGANRLRMANSGHTDQEHE